MKTKVWLCQRGSVFYLMEGATGRRTSLRTSDRHEAEQLLRARTEAAAQPALGLALGRAYFTACNPKLSQRTWQDVLAEYCSRGQPQTQTMRRRKIKQSVFDGLRRRPAALFDRRLHIQVKQKDNAGRPDIDHFEAVMMREERTVGFFVAFDYSEDAREEIGAFFKRTGRMILALTVQDILDEAKLGMKLA